MLPSLGPEYPKFNAPNYHKSNNFAEYRIKQMERSARAAQQNGLTRSLAFMPTAGNNGKSL
ncbi:hypothetical protein NBRC116594_37440 [Shimia sp. NS0008-38b]